MRKGRKQKINWSEHASPRFNIKTPEAEIECGAWALHVLTKAPYHMLLNLGKNGHYPDKVMFGFLKHAGFKVTPITLGNVVESQSVKTGKSLLTTDHVILIEQGCFEEESTWAVLYGGKISHSGDLSDIGPMEFVNWPILQAFLITHERWKHVEAKK